MAGREGTSDDTVVVTTNKGASGSRQGGSSAMFRAGVESWIEIERKRASESKCEIQAED